MKKDNLDQIKQAVSKATDEGKVQLKPRSWVRKPLQLPTWLAEDVQAMADEQNRAFNNMVNTLLREAVIKWHQDNQTLPNEQ